jgi:hypothetical protein
MTQFHPADPETLEEYNLRFMKNSRVEGYGIEHVTQVSPCPFCAAPDWAKWRIIHVEEDMQKNCKCKVCERSARFVLDKSADGTTKFELIQTGGAPAADYLPIIKRVDN